MPTPRQLVHVGIKSSVLALDRATGDIVWQTHLRRGDFVNVALADGELFASARGELFRLDPTSGKILWHNRLPGFGWGIATIAGAVPAAPAAAAKKRRDEAAAAAAGSS